MTVTHPYICPNCGHRTTAADTTDLSGRPRGCERCGAALLFELLDDYYPAPDAAFFVCDADGRLIGCGRNAFELTGLEEEQVIGRPVGEALGLRFIEGEDPIATVLEWGVRAQNKTVELQGGRDRPILARADLFPDYEEGGLLLVLTPERG
jgi:PAS domain-containing protein